MALGRDAVVQQLRDLIVSGQITAEERLTETRVAKMLGVSRTPVRHALSALASSGFFEKVGARGYRVREYSLDEVFQAIDVRCSLEGQAARIVTERGASAELIRQLKRLLQEGDAFLEARPEEISEEYSRINVGIHNLIVRASGSKLLAGMIAHVSNIPFASSVTETFSANERDKVYSLLHYAHQQHHYIAEAMEARQSGRVEALFREHATPAKQCVEILTQSAIGDVASETASERKGDMPEFARVNTSGRWY